MKFFVYLILGSAFLLSVCAASNQKSYYDPTNFPTDLEHVRSNLTSSYGPLNHFMGDIQRVLNGFDESEKGASPYPGVLAPWIKAAFNLDGLCGPLVKLKKAIGNNADTFNPNSEDVVSALNETLGSHKIFSGQSLLAGHPQDPDHPSHPVILSSEAAMKFSQDKTKQITITRVKNPHNTVWTLTNGVSGLRLYKQSVTIPDDEGDYALVKFPDGSFLIIDRDGGKDDGATHLSFEDLLAPTPKDGKGESAVVNLAPPSQNKEVVFNDFGIPNPLLKDKRRDRDVVIFTVPSSISSLIDTAQKMKVRNGSEDAKGPVFETLHDIIGRTLKQADNVITSWRVPFQADLKKFTKED